MLRLKDENGVYGFHFSMTLNVIYTNTTNSIADYIKETICYLYPLLVIPHLIRQDCVHQTLMYKIDRWTNEWTFDH